METTRSAPPVRSKRFAGKSVIVTGGAMGMGRAIAVRMAFESARVSIFDIDAMAGNKTVEMIAGVGGSAVYQRCDLTSADEVREAVEAHVAYWGGLDILINNAGFMHRDDDLLENITDEAWRATFAVNLYGSFHCCKYALPHMIAAGKGVIVTSASNAGVIGTTRPSYGASKGAAIGLTLAIARQYADCNIRANVVLPGAFATPMLETVRHYPITVARPRYVPLERIADPDEIAGAIAFLASDDSAFISGAVFPVDGGSTAV